MSSNRFFISQSRAAGVRKSLQQQVIAMKKHILLLLCLAIASGSGCLHQRSASGSFDGLSSDYVNDARILAEQTAEELSRRHAPAHTAIALRRVPGTFGETLEQRLREDGFAPESVWS